MEIWRVFKSDFRVLETMDNIFYRFARIFGDS